VPSKNLDHAIETVRALRDQGQPATLEIVGRSTGAFAQHLVARHRDTPGITFTLDASQAEKERALARPALDCTAIAASILALRWLR